MKKSLIVVNSSASDQSTNDIIDWMLMHKKRYVRINEDIIIFVTALNFENFNYSSIVKIDNMKNKLERTNKNLFLELNLSKLQKLSILFSGEVTATKGTTKVACGNTWYSHNFTAK